MAIIMKWGAFILADNVEIMAIELAITADPSIKIVQSIGSVLHGVLMELVGTEYAGQLHETGLRPYSQYIYFDKEKGQYIWRLSAVTAEAVERILRRLAHRHVASSRRYSYDYRHRYRFN